MRKISFLLFTVLLIGCGGGGGGGETSGSGTTRVVTTLAASSITPASAILNGTVIPNGLQTQSWFEYGTDSGLATFTTSAKQDAGNGVTGQPANLTINGLLAGTTYYFRICAENSKGASKGLIVSFTTSSPGSPPTVVTLAATTVTAIGATLNGNVSPNGLATTTWFEWGTDSALATFSSTSPQSVGSGTTSQLVSAALTGLSTGTTYYYRVAATNSSGTSRGTIGNVQITAAILTGTLTYHNDTARTGQNLQETLLTPANVNTSKFGKLFSFHVDGYIYAQPLYVKNVPIGGQLHNVVIVATEHDSVYAFDADNQVPTPLWQVSFIDPSAGVTTVPSGDVSCTQIVPEIGITGTPVIDPATGTLYVVAKTKENGTYVHRIHALDITSGSAKPGSGVVMQSSVPGTGIPNDGHGNVLFGYDSLLASQRAALLLSNNDIYVTFASYCDMGPYHGWAMAYNAMTLALVATFNATPNGDEGGIWQSGAGPAADIGSNVYLASGNGTFDADSGGSDFGDSFLKLNGTTLTVTDYFTPHDQADISTADQDIGSGGAVLLPDQSVGPQHLLVGAGKNGTIYLLDRDNMGHFQPGSDNQIVQSLPFALGSQTGVDSFFGVPAYFGNTLYFVGSGDFLRGYALSNGKLGTTPASQSANVFPFPGAVPVVSANGSNNGIVWAIDQGTGRAVLRAYPATDVSVELYNSDQNVSRDDPGLAVKFSVPTVANGKVYVGTQDRLTVFGLLP